MSDTISFENVRLVPANVPDAVTLINAFTVPVEESEQFLFRWKDNARIMAAQPGFIRAVMYQSLDDQAELRFIQLTAWESGTALDKARTNPEWRASVQRMLADEKLHLKARPVVYTVALDIHPGDTLE
ncbi:antibiotic biosynthesis monooxygenase family protein [Pendulispora albinea]|uniref:Antibiotic biosynthesis monooxygenase n=1 Tax=Pendulispora albinea TaxID=2741071 RepID=A0ABZ2M0F3_9BACT